MSLDSERLQLSEDFHLNEKQKSIINYLIEESNKEDGVLYIRSREIGEEVDLTPREVGTNLGMVKDCVDQLEIKKWAKSNSVTWKVTE